MATLPTIDPERLARRHNMLAAIGATPNGGVDRLALTELDIEAHVLLAGWAEARGFEIQLDAIGNMFIRRPGTDPSLAPVASGSHTDTQPKGGAFDGAVGVIAAFEALEAIDDAGLETRHPLEVIVWNNEEGARYLPACLGSAVHAGALPLEPALAQVDAGGVSLGSCVADLAKALPNAGNRPLGARLATFIEAHIEQGTILEQSGNIIGVVSGMQGYRRFTVTVTGESAHSGATPHSRRRDAFIAATDMAVALRREIADDTDTVRFTISRFEIPGAATSIVPGEVIFGIDLRHPDPAALTHFGQRIAELCEQHKGVCDVTVEEINHQPPLVFPEDLKQRIVAAAERHDLPHQPILSAAGHDARHASALGPAGMIFIPCRDGISHNEREHAEPHHIAAAAQVIADLLAELAGDRS